MNTQSKTQLTALVAGLNKTLTTAPVDSESPEWIRPADVPKRFGFSRATIYRLIAAGKVKSHLLRITGNKGGGVRLVSTDSLRNLISQAA